MPEPLDYSKLLMHLRAPRRRIVTTDPCWAMHGVSGTVSCPFDPFGDSSWWYGERWLAGYALIVACELALPAWGEWAAALFEYELLLADQAELPAQVLYRFGRWLEKPPRHFDLTRHEAEGLALPGNSDPVGVPVNDLVGSTQRGAIGTGRALEMTARSLDALSVGRDELPDYEWEWLEIRDTPFNEAIAEASIAWGRLNFDPRATPDMHVHLTRFCEHLWTVVCHRLAFVGVERGANGDVERIASLSDVTLHASQL